MALVGSIPLPQGRGRHAVLQPGIVFVFVSDRADTLGRKNTETAPNLFSFNADENTNYKSLSLINQYIRAPK